jgi:hypothetical protein
MFQTIYCALAQTREGFPRLKEILDEGKQKANPECR